MNGVQIYHIRTFWVQGLMDCGQARDTESMSPLSQKSALEKSKQRNVGQLPEPINYDYSDFTL